MSEHIKQIRFFYNFNFNFYNFLLAIGQVPPKKKVKRKATKCRLQRIGLVVVVVVVAFVVAVVVVEIGYN